MEKNETEVWTDGQGAVFSADKKTLWHCPDIEEYVIPNHAEYILPDAFDTAPRLKKIDFNRVVEIPCRIKMDTIDVPVFHGSSWQGDFDEESVSRHHSLFEKCPLVEEIKLSENEMKSIGLYAFADCRHIQSFCVPRSTHAKRFMNIRVLYGCRIKHLTLLSNFVYDLYGSWFNYCNGPQSVSAGKLEGGCLPSLETVHILFDDSNENLLATINILINGCRRLKTIYLPSDVLKQIEDELPQKDSIDYFGE